VLFVTGRGSIVDKTRGFGAGGDDYLVKPFSPEELRLRVDALLRRAGPPSELQAVVVGDLQIDPQTRLVRRDGQSLSLSPAELDVLVALASTPGRPWSAERLAQLLRLPEATAVETRGAMRVRMSRLRHRIEPDPERPRYIHHLRGSGYLLDFRPD
jgi:DNA-binding response OmpR family regulator